MIPTHCLMPEAYKSKLLEAQKETGRRQSIGLSRLQS